MQSSPALGADGTVYIGCHDATVYALDAASGRKRWVSEWGHEGSPAIGADGTVYVVGNAVHQDWVPYRVHGTVQALDGMTGRPLWRWESPVDTGTTYGTPSIGADGTLYILGTTGRLFALNGATGAGRSVSSSNVILETSATLDGVEGMVIHGLGNVYAPHAETGELLWECPVPWGQVFPRSCRTIGRDGIVYVGSEKGRVYAIQGKAARADSPWPRFRGDAANTGRVNVEPLPPALPRILEQPTGVRMGAGDRFALSVTATGQPFPTLQWYFGEEPIAGATEPTLEVTTAHLTDTGDYRVFVCNPVGSVTSVVARVIVGYHLYVSARPSGNVQLQPSLSVYEPGQLVALTALPRAGQTFLRWEGDAQGVDNPLTLVVDRHLTVEAVFTAAVGDLKWQCVTGGAVDSSPALGTDGTLYFGSGERIHALDGATGSSRWSYRTGQGSRFGPIAIGANGTVLAESSDPLWPATWQDVNGATSPYEVEPANTQRFYRVRRPRSQRLRRGACCHAVRRPRAKSRSVWSAALGAPNSFGRTGLPSTRCRMNPAFLPLPGSGALSRSKRKRLLPKIAVVGWLVVGLLGALPARAAVAFTASVGAGAAEQGFVDGSGADARFGSIVAVDGDGAGNLYVADARNHRIRKVDRRGQVTTLAGTGEARARDGSALNAAFRELRDLGVDATGNCYVLDGEDLRLLSAGGVVSTLGSIRIPTGEHSYTNHVGPFWDPVLETCVAEEWFRVSSLAVSPVGEVFVLGTATKQVRSDSLKWSVAHFWGTTNTQALARTPAGWEPVVAASRFHFTCSGCVPVGTPPPDSVEGRLIVALSKSAGRGILTASEECRGTAERFGRVDAVDQRVERSFATNLVGLPKIIDLADYGSDAVLLLGHGDSGNRFFAVGHEGRAFEVPSDRAPDIGLVVDRHGILYSATPTAILRFVPEGLVVLELETVPSGGNTLVLSTVAAAGRSMRVEQSVDLRAWEVWRTFTSSGRDEWDIIAPPAVRWFRACSD